MLIVDQRRDCAAMQLPPIQRIIAFPMTQRFPTKMFLLALISGDAGIFRCFQVAKFRARFAACTPDDVGVFRSFQIVKGHPRFLFRFVELLVLRISHKRYAPYSADPFDNRLLLRPAKNSLRSTFDDSKAALQTRAGSTLIAQSEAALG
jgi:hypothetical protein